MGSLIESPYASLMARYDSFQSDSWPVSPLKRYMLAVNGYRRRPGGDLVECFVCLTSINRAAMVEVFESTTWSSAGHHSIDCHFFHRDTLRCTICLVDFLSRREWRGHHLERHVLPDFTGLKAPERPLKEEEICTDTETLQGGDSGSGVADSRLNPAAAAASVLGKRKHSDSPRPDREASHSAQSLPVLTVMATFNPLDRTIMTATVDNVDSQKEIPLRTAADVVQRLCHTGMEITSSEVPGRDLEILGMSVLVKMTQDEYLNLKVHVDTIRLMARSRA
ncbi:uncharacterized protein E0L32_009957 [Thyridium curvatum]|uniref:Uncharacterized protein n=1 Tax=Thyridium curvatum TaxID=1093900 RepID=A0A507AUT7_9PEZI|nr:uncharacterized protein E0L32_009957 [Thyridium curvatum]TPX08618.1 hypothetical protein E0L32_009957 [Thyridium curvatum]